jgi:hypothetical protein
MDTKPAEDASHAAQEEIPLTEEDQAKFLYKKSQLVQAQIDQLLKEIDEITNSTHKKFLEQKENLQQQKNQQIVAFETQKNEQIQRAKQEYPI